MGRAQLTKYWKQTCCFAKEVWHLASLWTQDLVKMPMVGTGASRLAQEAAQDKGINNDVHRLEPMQGKEPAHFLAHFLRHSSSTSGDQGGGFSSEARLWRASDSFFS